MIPRYSRKQMTDIWSAQSKFRIWFEIEAHACHAMAELGVIPKDAAKVIWEKGSAARFDVARIDEIEARLLAIYSADLHLPGRRVIDTNTTEQKNDTF